MGVRLRELGPREELRGLVVLARGQLHHRGERSALNKAGSEGRRGS